MRPPVRLRLMVTFLRQAGSRRPGGGRGGCFCSAALSSDWAHIACISRDAEALRHAELTARVACAPRGTLSMRSCKREGGPWRDCFRGGGSARGQEPDRKRGGSNSLRAVSGAWLESHGCGKQWRRGLRSGGGARQSLLWPAEAYGKRRGQPAIDSDETWNPKQKLTLSMIDERLLDERLHAHLVTLPETPWATGTAAFRQRPLRWRELPAPRVSRSEAPAGSARRQRADSADSVFGSMPDLNLIDSGSRPELDRFLIQIEFWIKIDLNLIDSGSQPYGAIRSVTAVVTGWAVPKLLRPLRVSASLSTAGPWIQASHPRRVSAADISRRLISEIFVASRGDVSHVS